MSASVRDRSGDRSLALSDLTDALSMAAPEHIVRPFLRFRQIIPLLRIVVQTSGGRYLDAVVVDFAKEILRKNAAANSTESEFEGKANFSTRQQEVLEELSGGRSNKEIARALGMTENTVKFHLKHIYSKLNVKTRTQAVAHMRLGEKPGPTQTGS